jgi:hypothetical protein
MPGVEPVFLIERAGVEELPIGRTGGLSEEAVVEVAVKGVLADARRRHAEDRHRRRAWHPRLRPEALHHGLEVFGVSFGLVGRRLALPPEKPSDPGRASSHQRARHVGRDVREHVGVSRVRQPMRDRLPGEPDANDEDQLISVSARDPRSDAVAKVDREMGGRAAASRTWKSRPSAKRDGAKSLIACYHSR